MTKHTTIRLPEELLRQAKRKAAADGRTFTALVEDALRAALAASPPKVTRRKIVFPRVSSASGGLIESTSVTWHNLSNDVQELDDIEYVERMRNEFR